MSAAAAVPPSPKHDRVNAHPYAIKTTSTALLTRSNSTGTNNRASLHSYTPTPSPSTPSHALRSYHRPTRSMSTTSNGSADAPRPLPMPPSPSTPSRFPGGFPGSTEDLGSVSDGEQGARLRRSETLPAAPNSAGSPSLASLLSLPENPKVWTPSHLSKYLASALRFKGDGAVPDRIAADIAAFVYEQKLSGRVFLRLTETDLDAMGVNARWREALLAASRELRARVLQGRIWGFGSEPEADTGSPRRKRRMPSTVDEGEESAPPSPTKSEGGGHVRARTESTSSRVRDMVQSFERAASESSDDSAHLVPLPRTPRRPHRRSDTGGNEAGPEDEDGVASDKDSDAFMSDSDAGVEADGEAVGEEDITELHVGADLTPSKPVQSTVVQDLLVEEPVEDAEPSMEELLAAQGGVAWGANAWEADTLAGDTVRRVENLSSGSDGSARLHDKPAQADALADFFSPALLAELAPYTPATTVEPEPEPEPLASKEEVDALRATVRALEARIGILEARVATAEDVARRAAEDGRTRALAAELAALEADARRVEADSIVEALEARLAALEERAARSGDEEHEKRGEPLVPIINLGEVPAYVALVGLGVCAVVMRSVLRRVARRV